MPALYLSNPPLAHHDGQRIQTKTAKPRRRVPPLSLSTSAGKRALASIIEVCASRVGVAHAARRGVGEHCALLLTRLTVPALRHALVQYLHDRKAEWPDKQPLEAEHGPAEVQRERRQVR